MRSILCAIAQLDEQHVRPRDLVHHLPKGLACPRWICLEQSHGELDLTGDRGERLGELADYSVPELALGTLRGTLHGCPPTSGRAATSRMGAVAERGAGEARPPRRC